MTWKVGGSVLCRWVLYWYHGVGLALYVAILGVYITKRDYGVRRVKPAKACFTPVHVWEGSALETYPAN